MRHKHAFRRLGVRMGQRKALISNLNTSLAEHGQIKTTLPRAKEVKREFDKLITLGKKGHLHSRRLAYSKLKTEKSVYQVFDVYAPHFKDRPGGYTRVLRLANRYGDNAPMALVQVVDYENMKAKGSVEAKVQATNTGQELASQVKTDLQKSSKAKDKRPT